MDVVDIGTATVVRTITIHGDDSQAYPAIAFTPGGHTALVVADDSNAGTGSGHVAVIDVATGSVVETIPVAGLPLSVAIN